MALNDDLVVLNLPLPMAEPSLIRCRHVNIFLLCSSPVRANGHLCLGVLAIAIGSADGGPWPLVLALTVAWP